jgi:hypothetical protein
LILLQEQYWTRSTNSYHILHIIISLRSYLARMGCSLPA